MVEAEGIADGNDRLAGHDVGGVAQTHGGQIMRVLDFQHRDVEIRFRALDRGGEFTPVQQVNHDFVAAGNDVGVGQHQALAAVHNDAGPQADAFPLPGLRAEAAGIRKAGSEAGSEKTLQRGGAVPLDNMSAGDVDHRRGHGLHGADHGGEAGAVGRGRGLCFPDGLSGKPGQQAEEKEKEEPTDALDCTVRHVYLPQYVSPHGIFCPGAAGSTAATGRVRAASARCSA